jgi:ABC-type Fe3+/spermidine/putrescine transport system ATPase subunit
MTPIQLQRVSKRLGDTLAVDDVQLEVEAGELFFLLGPSGCGKTTLLNLVAGLIEPSAGRISFGTRDVTRVPTHERNAVMCFQSYALWPHLSVLDNVRFGLKARHLPEKEQQARARQALELVHMSEFAARKPAELSGGQQQRVAIARAVAVQPACLLLDEPLSNLDTRLRQQMRGEIRDICRTTGLTTLYVTHDQKEALSVADRIAIMKSGRVVQVGTPAELYTRPATAFVAEFLGQANLIAGRIVERGAADGVVERQVYAHAERLVLETAVGRMLAYTRNALARDALQVTLSIRPEQIRIADGGAPELTRELPLNQVRAKVLESWFLGDCSEHRLLSGGCELRMLSVPPRLDLPEHVVLQLGQNDLVVLAEVV